MRVNRIYVDLPLAVGQRLGLPAAQSRHLIQVLRLRAGDPLVLFNGDGRDYPGRLVTASRSDSRVEIETAGEIEPEPPLAIHVGIGVSKGERMDFALQKAVELGVARITPLFTHRGVVRLRGERLEKRQRHWRSIAVATCEQCGRRRLPQLMPAATLADWLALDHPCALVLDHRAGTPLPSRAPPAGALTLLVGPEGGLDAAEEALAERQGFERVRLGPRILRTETAPLAAIAAAQALWGDLKD